MTMKASHASNKKMDDSLQYVLLNILLRPGLFGGFFLFPEIPFIQLC